MELADRPRRGPRGRGRERGGRRCMSSSRIATFHRLPVEERRRKLAEALALSQADREALSAADALPLEVADLMVENAVCTLALPFGVALNFVVNGREHVVPMVVEEPSVIAAASSAALIARAGGGFVAEADPGAMIGQIQLVRVPDPGAAVERLGAARARLLAAARELTPGLCRRGAGPRDLEARAVATGNDGRAIEAGAHGYACRGGSYGSLTTWAIDEEHLVGAIELPMAVSTVGPVVHSHPRVRLALRMLGVSSARELAAI